MSQLYSDHNFSLDLIRSQLAIFPTKYCTCDILEQDSICRRKVQGPKCSSQINRCSNIHSVLCRLKIHLPSTRRTIRVIIGEESEI